MKLYSVSFESLPEQIQEHYSHEVIAIKAWRNENQVVVKYHPYGDERVDTMINKWVKTADGWVRPE